MLTAQQKQIADLLEQVARSLDIPDKLHDEAVKKYEHVGHWLEEKDANLGRREPLVYPQGSFRLGTVIRPLSEKDEYDIDLVYERDLRKGSVSQEQLKEEAGEHLRAYLKHCRESHQDVPTLIEGRRCWRLDYPDRFHMDVLPAIPDDDGRQSWKEHANTKILITDSDLHEWQPSNPIGYAEWFKGRMAVQFREKRAALAMEAKAAAEDVPEYKVKTPLQRAIQILKRHRDFHFQDDGDRPISIIITTLAAKAYNNQANLLDALLTLVRDMPNHIETRKKNGKPISWVANPVNDGENFADKWEDNPQREVKFRAWLKKVDDDLTAALTVGAVPEVIDLLGGVLGSTTVTKAASNLGITKRSTSLISEGQAVTIPAIAGTRHCQLAPWLQDLRHVANIACTVHRREGDQQKLFDLTNRPVPKHLHLRFEVTTNATQPYEVHWQVVNTGEEAMRANGLRGGFDDDSNQNEHVRWEHTEYAGTHWIEAFIVRNRICVARSGRYFVRIPE